MCVGQTDHVPSAPEWETTAAFLTSVFLFWFNTPPHLHRDVKRLLARFGGFVAFAFACLFLFPRETTVLANWPLHFLDLILLWSGAITLLVSHFPYMDGRSNHR